MRLLDYEGLVHLIESKDYGSVGIDSDSFKLDKASEAGIVLTFGALTGNSILTLYTGATAGTKTTAIAARYRLSSGVFKAATLADQYAAAVALPSTGLTLTAATFQHNAMVIDLDAAEVSDSLLWLTVQVDATATVLNLAGFAVLAGPRYKPAVSMTV
jgi:hypothetical protein